MLWLAVGVSSDLSFRTALAMLATHLLVAEKFADGRGTHDDLLDAQMEAEYCTGSDSDPFLYVLDVPNGSSLTGVPGMCFELLLGNELQRLQDPKCPGGFRTKKDEAEFKRIKVTEKVAQFVLLSDITGDFSRPVKVTRTWCTPTVRMLAKEIYAERAFDQMLILADALEEAGRDNPDVLTHCRGPGPHVRGCWVVDLLLGKQ